jgi:DNA-binding MarR family transcriptional regulator
MEILDKRKYIFGTMISLSNRLQVIGDRCLSGDEITIKQWFLTLAVAQFGSNPPTLGDVSQIMSSSHQNVKQLALKLKEKGFILIIGDPKDNRVMRFKLTEKSYLFWKKHQLEVKLFLTELFNDLSQDEINIMCDCLDKLYDIFTKMEQSQK